MEKIGEYKLARVSGGIWRYAEVRVRIVEADATRVTVDPEAFAWLKEDYGPHAWEWPACDDYRDEAVQGCQAALERLEPQPQAPLHVIILRIHAHPVHTTAGSVKLAACRAVWRALGVEGSDTGTP